MKGFKITTLMTGLRAAAIAGVNLGFSIFNEYNAKKLSSENLEDPFIGPCGTFIDEFDSLVGASAWHDYGSQTDLRE